MSPVGTKCGLLVADVDSIVDDYDDSGSMNMCVEESMCDATYTQTTAMGTVTFDVYCDGKAFWYNNKVWIIIIIVLVVLLIIGAIFCCCCRKNNSSF